MYTKEIRKKIEINAKYVARYRILPIYILSAVLFRIFCCKLFQILYKCDQIKLCNIVHRCNQINKCEHKLINI